MVKIRQTWRCKDGGKVVCTETKEDCRACDGMANITTIAETYDLKVDVDGCRFSRLTKSCTPGVSVEGRTTETIEHPCGNKVIENRQSPNLTATQP